MTLHGPWLHAVEAAEPLLQELQARYRRLPETRCHCDTPGVCCAFIPEMTALEALGWLRLIVERPDPQQAEILRRFVSFYLTNPVRHAGCPLLLDGRCTAYDQRTFACRAYGLWSRRLGRRRTSENREKKGELLRAWKRYGITLPPDRVVSEMDYCEQVRCGSDDPLDDDALIACLESVYSLSCRLDGLQQRFESEYHSDFSFMMAVFTLGPKKAVLGKFAVIKEMVRSGGERRLAKMLEMVKPLSDPPPLP